MSMKETLDATRAASAARVPPDKRAIMERANEDLKASGILDGVAAVGQMAPTFTAQNHDGRTISSSALLANGPLVLSFFRAQGDHTAGMTPAGKSAVCVPHLRRWAANAAYR